MKPKVFLIILTWGFPFSILESILLTQPIASCSNICKEAIKREAAENVVGFWSWNGSVEREVSC